MMVTVMSIQHFLHQDISHNKLTGLPEDIGSLKKLKALNASNNELTRVPWTIGSLKGKEVEEGPLLCLNIT